MADTDTNTPLTNNPYVPPTEPLPPEESDRPVVMGHQIPEEPKKEGWRSIAATAAVLLVAPLVALLLTMFVFQSYEVEGPSMVPTLQDRDRLLVWKLPRTWARITNNHYVPARGDIVIFTEPKIATFDQAPDKQIIKRVIAFPGERVVVQDGTMTVYSKERPEGFQPDKEMPYGKSIITTNHDSEWTVGEGEIFVSGDNRIESLDSRSFGPIQLDNVIGKLSYRVLPIDKATGF